MFLKNKVLPVVALIVFGFVFGLSVLVLTHSSTVTTQTNYRYPAAVCTSSDKQDPADIVFVYPAPMMGRDGELRLKRQADGHYCGRWADDFVFTSMAPPMIVLMPKDGVKLDGIDLLLLDRAGEVHSEHLKSSGNGLISFFLLISEDDIPHLVTYPSKHDIRFFPGDNGE